jgi:DNA invertase Pin-like site-specific DNA recombinase
MTTTAIGYVRVSTTDQAVEGVSLTAQRERITAYCLANGLELVAVYEDAGISGKSAHNRPALVAALDDVCRRHGVLVTYSLSRLARSTKDTIAISERLERANADLVSLSEKIDTTSAAGKMLFRMLAVLAEFERDVISERTKTAMASKKSRGERCGQLQFGYRLSSDGMTLERDENEQRIIELIRELRDRGQTYKQIAIELTERKITTKNGKAKWHATQIGRILAA